MADRQDDWARSSARHEKETRPEKGPALVAKVLAVLTAGLAVGNGIHIRRVGDAGARAVREGVQNLPPRNGG